MSLNSTNYKNPSRTITGSAVLFKDDVVLLCDTSLGAVNFTLLDIPSDYWNTTWKLYVVDISNNAGTNNITINAPSGFKINGVSSLVISTNGGTASIRITSNIDYLAILGSGASGSGALAVLNEGTLLTPGASSINFVGGFVNATSIGTAVTVNVESNFVTLNYAALSTLISTNTLVPSQQYLITDAIFLTVATIETVPIIVEAVTTNEITLLGSGIFLNADYQKVGNYSSVTGYAGQLGVWESAVSYGIGYVVIWNNLHWVNLNGLNSGAPDVTPADWSLLAKTSTNGYITEIDIIKYRVSDNKISYREDLRNNRVEANFNTTASVATKEAFRVFQWGNDGAQNNTVFSESYFQIWNSSGLTNGNRLETSSFVTFTSGQNIGVFDKNIFENNSKITVISNVGEMDSNVFFETIWEISTLQPQTYILRNNFKFGNANVLIDGSTTISKGTIENTFVGDTPNSYVIENNSIFHKNNFILSEATVVNNQGAIKNNDFNKGILNVSATNNGLIEKNIVNDSEIRIAGSIVGSAVQNNVLNNCLFRDTTILSGRWADNEVNNSTITTTSPVGSGGTIISNKINDSSILTAVFLGEISLNKMSLSSFTVQGNFNALVKVNNNFWDYTTILFSGNLTNNIEQTWCEKANLTTTSIEYNIQGGIYQRNVGTIQYTLDLGNPAIFNEATFTLTIPSTYASFFGEYWLVNNPKDSEFRIISGLSDMYATKFVEKESGFNVIFRCVANVGASAVNGIVSVLTPPPQLYTLTQRIKAEDSIYIRKSGTLNAVEQVYIYS